MTVSEQDVEQAAGALHAAERDRQQVGLISKQLPGLTLEDAYAIQGALVQRKLADGRTVKGWKIGLTSKAMQDALKIDTPDSGILFDDMFFDSGATIPRDRFIQTRIEAEIAFIMGAPLAGGNTTREDVLAATKHVVPALEILDTRIVRADPETGAVRIVQDTIADNAANAGIVLGAEHHAPGDFDLRWVGAVVQRNGVVEETGLGAGVLNDPVMGIVWLANRLSDHNMFIAAGDTVLSGSFIRPIEARPGDSIEADYGPFGYVSCTF